MICFMNVLILELLEYAGSHNHLLQSLQIIWLLIIKEANKYIIHTITGATLYWKNKFKKYEPSTLNVCICSKIIKIVDFLMLVAFK